VVVDTVRIPKLFLTDQSGTSDMPVWEKVDYELQVPKSTLWRYRLSPSEGRFSKTPLADEYYLDFPSTNPRYSGRDHTYLYASAGRDSTYPTPVRREALFVF
jgi:carotenoid cleavage dioxygenase-like enzyme